MENDGKLIIILCVRLLFDRFTLRIQSGSATANDSVPKIIINDTYTVLFKTTIRILIISNHNSFQVLFDKIASVYFI